jgi:hypothetical protein
MVTNTQQPRIMTTLRTTTAVLSHDTNLVRVHRYAPNAPYSTIRMYGIVEWEV